MDVSAVFFYALSGIIYVVGFLLQPSSVHFYVSPSGSDSNDGLSQNHPLRTINKAASLVSELSPSDTDVYVELLPGYHDLTGPVTLTHKVTSLTIRPLNQTKVHVTGGKRIHSSRFIPVTNRSILSRLPVSARTKVKVVHLPDVGITNYGHMNEYGYYKERHAPLEVFFNSKPLRLARWPNEGFENVTGMPDGHNATRFQFGADEPTRWLDEDDLWAHGFWFYSWSDRALQIVKLDQQAKEITLSAIPPFGLRKGHWNPDPVKNAQLGNSDQGGYFRVINVLSELDEPGEYYLDRKTGNLYAWFPTSDGNVTSQDSVYVSLVDRCFQLYSGQKDVHFLDFTLGMCRINGIYASDVSNVTVRNMEIRNTGGYNVKFLGDSRNVDVSRNYFHDGDGGLDILGGDRPTLTPSGNLVLDNEITRFNREGMVGINGINVGGVGTVISHNHLYGGSYNIIRYWGNDHVMEYNDIHHGCLNSSDCGALMIDKDWTQLGNTIRYNHIHHTLHLVPGNPCRGIMLDDQSSGNIIDNNVFYNNYHHVNIGGGRNNLVRNNVMYDATKASMAVDGRGLKHKHDVILNQMLKAMPYKSALWTSHYPQLVNFDSQNKSLPEGNLISHNIFYNDNETAGYFDGLTPFLAQPVLYNITDNVWPPSRSYFESPDQLDFNVLCEVQSLARSFGISPPVATDRIGPRYDIGPVSNRRVSRRTGDPTIHCATVSPSVDPPAVAYLPDGSQGNHYFNQSVQGCWFEVSEHVNHDVVVNHPRRDTYGEEHEHAAVDEGACLSRAVKLWRGLGSPTGKRVISIYAPSGAMTTAGVGCYMAVYGCPSNDHVTTPHGHIYRDTYAEAHFNAGHSEQICLARAVENWKWCGSHRDFPVTAIYQPTGRVGTAGAGCWIHVVKCPRDPKTRPLFFDAFGSTNFNTDSNEDSCLFRADIIWNQCGADVNYPVTAHFRPTMSSRIVPYQ